jgi:hypothetical protein
VGIKNGKDLWQQHGRLDTGLISTPLRQAAGEVLRRAAEEVEAVPLGVPLHRGASRTSCWGGYQFPLLPTVAVVVEVAMTVLWVMPILVPHSRTPPPTVSPRPPLGPPPRLRCLVASVSNCAATESCPPPPSSRRDAVS